MNSAHRMNGVIPAFEIQGVEMTDKDFTCIAQHLQEYRRSIMCEESTVPNACDTCEYQSNCFKNGVSGSWFDTFKKVTDITNVNCINHAESKVERDNRKHLNYDDLLCIARHMQYFVKIAFHREAEESLLFPCQVCYLNGNGRCDDYPFADAIEKLSKLTGAEVSRWVGFRVLNNSLYNAYSGDIRNYSVLERRDAIIDILASDTMAERRERMRHWAKWFDINEVQLDILLREYEKNPYSLAAFYGQRADEVSQANTCLAVQEAIKSLYMKNNAPNIERTIDEISKLVNTIKKGKEICLQCHYYDECDCSNKEGWKSGSQLFIFHYIAEKVKRLKTNR